MTLSWKQICKYNICLKRTAVIIGGVITQTALVMQIITYKQAFSERVTAEEITAANRGQRVDIKSKKVCM